MIMHMQSTRVVNFLLMCLRCNRVTNISSFPHWNGKTIIPKIQSVRPLEGKRLLVKVVNGMEKIYNCNPLLHLKVFRLLNNEAFFKSVKVDPGGYGVSWNGDVDLSEYELYSV